MIKRYSDFRWYPPAETKVPFPKIWKAVRGPVSDAESKLCSFTGTRHSIFGPNAKSLLYQLLVSLNARQENKRDEVLIPGYTCYSVAASVAKAGLKIRLYDLNPKSLAPVEATIRQRCSEKTLAIISQHLFGLSCNIQPIGNIADSVGAFHIEDAAQGFGGSIEGKSIGTLGDFGLFSFGRGKPLPLGGGGAVVSNTFNPKDYFPPFPVVKGYTKLINTAATQVMADPKLYWIAEALPLGLGETIFDPEFNVGSVSEYLSSLFVNYIEELKSAVRHRQEISAIYRRNLPDHATVEEATKGAVSVYNRYPMYFGPHKIPYQLVQFGIRRMYPFAIGREPSIRPYLADKKDLTPGANIIAENIVTLPTHHAINKKLAQKIAKLAIRYAIQTKNSRHLGD